jgi:SAM-dependent methyltransferase
MTVAYAFDPVWDAKYGAGHEERYPWDAVVSFVFRHAPRDRPRAAVCVAEVGFGTGNNLWFAAREGFAVAGVEGSEAAVTRAQARFTLEGLRGDLRVGDFTALPFASNSVDLMIDRGALTCVGYSTASRAIAEVHRVLRPGGRFLFTPYGDHATSARAGTDAGDGLRTDITSGSMVGVGQICFYNESQVRASLAGWTLLSLERVDRVEMQSASPVVHAEWKAIAEKGR